MSLQSTPSGPKISFCCQQDIIFLLVLSIKMICICQICKNLIKEKFIEQEMLLRVNNTSEYFEKRWLLWRHIYTDIWYNCVIEKNDIFIKEMFSNCRIIKVFYIV